VYVGSYDGSIYALDGSTGETITSFYTGGAIEAAPAIGKNGALYFGNVNGVFYQVGKAVATLSPSPTPSPSPSQTPSPSSTSSLTPLPSSTPTPSPSPSTSPSQTPSPSSTPSPSAPQNSCDVCKAVVSEIASSAGSSSGASSPCYDSAFSGCGPIRHWMFHHLVSDINTLIAAEVPDQTICKTIGYCNTACTCGICTSYGQTQALVTPEQCSTGSGTRRLGAAAMWDLKFRLLGLDTGTATGPTCAVATEGCCLAC